MFESHGKYEPKLVYAHKRSDSQREEVAKTTSVRMNGSVTHGLKTNPSPSAAPVEAAPASYQTRLQNAQSEKQPDHQQQQKQQQEYLQQRVQHKQQHEYQQQQIQQKRQEYTQQQSENIQQQHTKPVHQPPPTQTVMKQQLNSKDSILKQQSISEAKLPFTSKTASVQPTEKVKSDLKKSIAPHVNILDDNNNKDEKFEGFRIYRGKNFDTKNEAQSGGENIIRQNGSTHSGTVIEKGKYEYSQTLSSGQNTAVIQNSDLKASSGVSFSSKTNVPNGPASPGFKQQRHQQNLSNEFQHQQRQQYPQHQNQHNQSHTIPRNNYTHMQEPRMQPSHQVTHTNGPSRHNTAKNIRLTGPTIVEANHVGNRPRASSAKVRPQSQTYVSTFQGPREQMVAYTWQPEDYHNYNRGRDPASSPRSNGFHPRSSYRLDQGLLVPQPTSSNPPKSILKNNVSLEQSDLYLSARPLVLPRPRSHSQKGPSTTHIHPDFDFSTILTANKDPLTSKQTPHIVVKGQVKNAYVPPMASASNPKRPVTAAGTALHRYELSNDNQPQRKSVTFNSKVRLHIDNQSTVRSLAVDAQ